MNLIIDVGTDRSGRVRITTGRKKKAKTVRTATEAKTYVSALLREIKPDTVLIEYSGINSVSEYVNILYRLMKNTTKANIY